MRKSDRKTWSFLTTPRTGWVEMLNGVFFDPNRRIGQPWKQFAEIFAERNVRFSDSINETNVDFLITCSHHEYILKIGNQLGISPNRRFLISFEPYVVDPFPFSRNATASYRHIWHAGHNLSSELRSSFPWPQNPWLFTTAADIEGDRPRIPSVVMMQANKFSAVRGELYSLRRQVASALVRKEIALDVFGRGWSKSWVQNVIDGLRAEHVRYSYSKVLNESIERSPENFTILSTKEFQPGISVENKHQVLTSYKVALAIENDSSYQSEKLFESLASGCITIYVGNPRGLNLSNQAGLIVSEPDVDAVIANILAALSAESNTLSHLTIRRHALQAFSNETHQEVFAGLAKSIWNLLNE